MFFGTGAVLVCHFSVKKVKSRVFTVQCTVRQMAAYYVPTSLLVLIQTDLHIPTRDDTYIVLLCG